MMLDHVQGPELGESKHHFVRGLPRSKPRRKFLHVKAAMGENDAVDDLTVSALQG